MLSGYDRQSNGSFVLVSGKIKMVEQNGGRSARQLWDDFGGNLILEQAAVKNEFQLH